MNSQEWQEDDLNFRDSSYSDDSDTESENEEQIINLKKDESEDEEEQEPSFYMAVLTQLQLYEVHSDIAERIDINAVEQNVIRIVQPQHRTESVVENDQEKLHRFQEKI